jgi:two-component system, response regulator PdtaR
MKTLNILVVEDDETIAELLADVLADMGHVVCAIEATEAGAVAAAARHKPELMIVDVQLGNGSGIAAVESITRSRPVPHVFASGNIGKVLALRPAAVALQKPYTVSDLASAMQRALSTPAPA